MTAGARRPSRADVALPQAGAAPARDRGRRPLALVLSCEHASAHVPTRHARLFAGDAGVLATHRGIDLGASTLARGLARHTGAPLVLGRVTRLLVDLNRSPGRRGLFSEYSRALPPEERAALVARWHEPHWQAVAGLVEAALRRGSRALHLGVHSFTPELAGRVRDFDVGLLYDPAREAEAALCRRFTHLLQALDPGLRVRANQPYSGAADGLTTAFRARFGARAYLGIELEINQQRLGSGAPGAAVRRAVRGALQALIDD